MRVGDSLGNERGFDQSFVTAVRGKYPGFALYMPKGQSLHGGALSGDLLDQKSKSLLFPGTGGAVATNDWCIIARLL